MDKLQYIQEQLLDAKLREALAEVVADVGALIPQSEEEFMELQKFGLYPAEECIPFVTEQGSPFYQLDNMAMVPKGETSCYLHYGDFEFRQLEVLYIMARMDSAEAHHWLNSFIYENYSENARFYRQKYTKEGDMIAFDGEPVEVFSEWLTQEEVDALNTLKSEYAELKSFKEQYDANALKAEKDAVFESAEYAEIKETEEFKALVADADKYSVNEIKVKADLIFAAAMKEKMNFEVAEPVKTHSVSINLNAKPDKKKPYGRLFS